MAPLFTDEKAEVQRGLKTCLSCMARLHLGYLCVWVLVLSNRKHVSRQAESPAGHPEYSLKVVVTDRLRQCWTRGPLAYLHEARAK